MHKVRMPKGFMPARQRIQLYYQMKKDFYQKDGVRVNEFQCNQECGEKRCYCKSQKTFLVGKGCPFYPVALVAKFNIK